MEQYKFNVEVGMQFKALVDMPYSIHIASKGDILTITKVKNGCVHCSVHGSDGWACTYIEKNKDMFEYQWREGDVGVSPAGSTGNIFIYMDANSRVWLSMNHQRPQMSRASPTDKLNECYYLFNINNTTEKLLKLVQNMSFEK